MKKFLLISLLLFGCGKEVTVGPMGPQGPAGIKGDTGEAGSSCTVVDTEDGANIICDDGSTAIIKDGEDGTTITCKKIKDHPKKGKLCEHILHQIGI